MGVNTVKHNDQEYNLAAMSRDELVALKLEIETAIVLIRGQLETARSNAAAHGIYSDPDWFRSATLASRLKGVDLQKIQNALGQLKRRSRQGRPHLPEVFMDAARDMLDPDLFDGIYQEASARAQHQGESR